MAELEVFVPIAETRSTEQQLAPRVSKLAQSKITIFDNQKANARELLATVAEQLVSEHGQIELVSRSKNATTPASDDLMAHLKACDAVILAIADWGSCTSWSVHDAIALEAAGVPTALLCSDEFAPLARAESQVLGLGSLPLIVIPHPLAGNSEQLVDAKACAIASEVTYALSATPTQLANHYREQFLQPAERRLAGGEYCVDTSCRIDPAITE